MIIKEFAIKNFRGVDHLRLKEIPGTGVIVISGDNEAGKSTILEALKNILTQPHGGNNRFTRPTQQIDNPDGPQAYLHAEIGEYEFTLYKKWKKSSKARLNILRPNAENLVNDEAEKKLAEIMDSHVDEALMKTLFVEQGELGPSFETAGIPSIARALEADGDGAESTMDEAGIVKKVETIRNQYFTPQGNHRKDLSDEIKAVDALASHVEELTADNERLRVNVEEVEKVTKDLEETTDVDLPAAQALLAQAQEERDKAEVVAGKLEMVRAKVAEAKAKRENISQNIAHRDQLRTELEQAQSAHQEAEQKLELAKEKADKEEAELAEFNKAKEELATAITNANDDVVSARAVLDQVHAAASHTQAQSIVDAVAALNAQDEEDKELPKVSSADVADAENAEQDWKVATAMFEQSATTIELSADSTRSITVGDQAVEVGPDAEVRYLEGATTLDIDGVSVTITPSGPQDPRREVELTAQRLEKILTRLECESVTELREKRDAYQQQKLQREARDKERARILGGKTVESLQHEIETLENGVLKDVDIAELPESDVAAKQLKEAESVVQSLGQGREKLIAANSALAERPARTALTIAQSALEQTQDRMAAATAKLGDDEQETLTLNTQLESADAAVTAAEVELNATEQALGDTDIDQVRAAHKHAENRVASLENRKYEYEIRKARLHSVIDNAEGIAERLELAQLEYEQAKTRLAAKLRRARAADKLYTTLVHHRDTMRQKYAAPFAAELTRLAKPIFGPDVSFELDENLRITSRISDGLNVDVAHLSGGAKEQLGIIARLAVSSLAGGTEMPVFIDDALGSTDPERVDIMASILNNAGHSAQIFVFTCDSARYKYVLDKKEYRMNDIKLEEETGVFS